ncbi:MAG: electron transport complex subunit RsxC [Silanimonas sp.]
MGLRRFFGGLRLPAVKPVPAPVQRLPLPARLRVPLLQHAGVAAEPCVAIGERITRFQRIGRMAEDALGANVHAPASGVIVGLERGPVALPGTPEAMHVVIDVEATAAGAWLAGDASGETEARLLPLDPLRADVDTLRARIAEAGIVGLGGAGFPAADKLAVGRRLLILNGAECEPVVACDEALLRERAAKVVAGGRMLARLCGATRIVLAMEERMASALPAVRAALDDGDTADSDSMAIELALLPDRYPAGGERQLIQAITGEEVPDGGLPRDLGVLVQNVGTVYAAWRAVVHGEPLVSRFVTVGGDGINRAATFEVAIGTPVSTLGAALGGWREDAATLRAGGPMMGVALPHDDVAIGKTTIAITAWRDAARTEAMPCIRCGDCATACPSRLQPQLIHARLQANDAPGATGLGLSACIECGACDAACPSAIPLTSGFIAARRGVRLAEHQRAAAEAAKQRFERRVERLQREAEEAAGAQAQRLKRVSGAAAAALAKARAKREGADGDAPGVAARREPDGEA